MKGPAYKVTSFYFTNKLIKASQKKKVSHLNTEHRRIQYMSSLPLKSNWKVRPDTGRHQSGHAPCLTPASGLSH